jgi:hypothetical protein
MIGVQLRQVEEMSSEPDPMMQIQASYIPRDGTRLGLSVLRSEQNSARFANQNHVRTSFALSASQALPRRLSVNASVGYSAGEYHATAPGVVANRTDSSYFANARLGWSLVEDWQVSLVYQRYANLSNEEDFEFSQNTVGLQVNWSF